MVFNIEFVNNVNYNSFIENYNHSIKDHKTAQTPLYNKI
ncbi:hypothetical protein HME9304_03035 [Flagellimonas maritima]|uniref:Uncharacterized protein n=1 Tax=Flagellimonas maritima TaxID=1383885 RepID=A0A2Z4LWF3_9FLAO|nr:hypothetical protein HME9304_03035 [Allomuricauda aurantiaca]